MAKYDAHENMKQSPQQETKVVCRTQQRTSPREEKRVQEEGEARPGHTLCLEG